MSADTLQLIDTKVAEPGDHELFAHYVRKVAMEQAIFDGIPATALCGKKWLPTKDATRYPVCPDCKGIFEDDERFLGSNV